MTFDEALKNLEYLSSPDGERLADPFRLHGLIMASQAVTTHVEHLVRIISHLEDENADYRIANRILLDTIKKLADQLHKGIVANDIIGAVNS